MACFVKNWNYWIVWVCETIFKKVWFAELRRLHGSEFEARHRFWVSLCRKKFLVTIKVKRVDC